MQNKSIVALITNIMLPKARVLYSIEILFLFTIHRKKHQSHPSNVKFQIFKFMRTKRKTSNMALTSTFSPEKFSVLPSLLLPLYLNTTYRCIIIPVPFTTQNFTNQHKPKLLHIHRQHVLGWHMMMFESNWVVFLLHLLRFPLIFMLIFTMMK